MPRSSHRPSWTTLVRWARRPAATVAAAVFIACFSNEPLVPPFAQAFVFGVVTDSAGGPVGEVTVVVEVRRAADSTLVGEEPGGTDTNGRYALLLAVFGDPFDAIIGLRVTPPATSPLQEKRVDGLRVRFDDPGRGLDSLRADVVLVPKVGAGPLARHGAVP